ncbi:MAG: sulfotransferase [Symploca sp. SIO2D2]|nr:sulfotransferase [Symploca sp. SIO2D2]
MPKLLYILGVCQRTGTNYLHDLVSTHPDAQPSSQIWEDQAITTIQYLDKYARTLDIFWRKYSSPKHARLVSDLKENLGNAVTESIAAQTDDPNKLLITKTPSVFGIERIGKYFPKNKFIFLTRDGRSTAQSFSKSFSTSFVRSCLVWRDGARKLIGFLNDAKLSKDVDYIVIRYEDLQTDFVKTITQVLEFCQLDPSKYNFDGGENMAVRGSSTLVETQDKVSWQKVEKDSSFKPLERYKSWSRIKTESFNALCLTEQTYFGYQDSPKLSTLATLLKPFLKLYVFIIRLPDSLKNRLKSKVLNS